MGRSGYIAFPRLGRGYLAFPRLGRSGSGSDVTSGSGSACCSVGLKTEWLLEEGGKTSTQDVCEADVCCEDLTEIMAQKPNGAFYTICIPSCRAADSVKSPGPLESVLRKLKGMPDN